LVVRERVDVPTALGSATGKHGRHGRALVSA
jgi:hypothetical protein